MGINSELIVLIDPATYRVGDLNKVVIRNAIINV